MDALNNQEFLHTIGLKDSYKDILDQRKNVLESWQTYNPQAMILSYHLNQKINQLEEKLKKYSINHPVINGKLYSKAI